MIIGSYNNILEKSFCGLIREQPQFLGEENSFYESLNIFKFSKKNSQSSNPSFNKSECNLENLNHFPRDVKSIEYSFDQYFLQDSIASMNFICEKSAFISENFNDLITIRRRKRRKFATEEERRIARILKNRRTAEESRQRRIQKMRTLENFVSISEEREKKNKEDLRVIGIQSAIRFVELFLIKKIEFM